MYITSVTPYTVADPLKVRHTLCSVACISLIYAVAAAPLLVVAACGMNEGACYVLHNPYSGVGIYLSSVYNLRNEPLTNPGE